MPSSNDASEEARLRAIIEATGAGTWEWNLTTNDVLLNERWCQMLGYPLAELTPITRGAWETMMHPDDITRVRQEFIRHLQGESDHYDCLYRMRHRDGSWRWIQDRGGITVLGEGKQKARWFIGTHVDVTTEIEYRHYLEKLSQSLPGMIYSFSVRANGDFYFSYISEQSWKLFGLRSGAILINPQSLFDAIAPEDRDRVWETVEESRQTLETWRCQYRVQNGGQTRWVEGVSQPERDIDGTVTWHGILVDIDERKALELELEELSVTDELTKLFNRRHLIRKLDEYAIQRDRYGGDYALISLDIDHFKQVNDSWGHLVGDRVLTHVARILENNVRQADIVARTGGEEFMILLPETSLSAAMTVAEKLRVAIAGEAFQSDEGDVFHISASSGVTSWTDDLSNVRAVLSACDRALYEAKAQGRNRVITLR